MVQSRTVLALMLLVVFTVGAWAGPMSILPVIDRPGTDAYCQVAQEALGTAERSIDILLSNGEWEDNPLWDVIIAAHGRGVEVRVLLDQSDWAPAITEKNRPTVDALRAYGIDARLDDPETTIHAKLVVVDRRAALLGSSNWNDHAFLDQEQTNVLIDDPRVGEAFCAVFDRVWNGDLDPGGLALPEAPNGAVATVVPVLDVDSTALYAELALQALAMASESVHLVMYRLSVYPGYGDSAANRLVAALVAAAGRGIDVRVVLDDCNYYPESAQANLTAALYLAEQGIAVRFDEPNVTTHAKLVLVDGRHTLLGSTNWNYYSVERNIEANAALLGMPEVARIYEAFFERVWSEGREIADR